MSAKTNYYRLGIFVIVGVALGISGIIVFGGLELIPEKALFIETYVEDTVQGLATGSKVKRRGVTVGNVEEIGFVAGTYDLPPDQYTEYGTWVRILIRILPHDYMGTSVEELERILPEAVEEGLRIRLTSAGLTGGKFLEAADLDPKRFPAFEPPWKPKHAYIPAAEGVFEAIVSSVDQIIEKIKKLDVADLVKDVDQLVVGINQGVEEAQIAKLSAKAQALLDDFHKIVGGEDVKQSLANFRQTSEDLEATVSDLRASLESGDLHTAVENVSASTEGLRESVDRLPGMLNRLDRFMISEAGEVESTLIELRILIQNLRELTDMAKRYPAAVLFGKEPPESKPEEKP